MATERIAGFEQFVGRWEEARHRLALADGRHAYFIGRDGLEPIGFVIVRDWASPERVAVIKRIAVSRPGQGYGRAAARPSGRRGVQRNQRVARVARRFPREHARAPRL